MQMPAYGAISNGPKLACLASLDTAQAEGAGPATIPTAAVKSPTRV
jgi:hypothetical protein